MLIWWIDSIRVKPRGEYFRYFVAGAYQDTGFPDAEYNGQPFFWTVPDLRGGGGRYVFRLRAV